MRAQAVKIYFAFCLIVAGIATYANFHGYYFFEKVLSRVQVIVASN